MDALDDIETFALSHRDTGAILGLYKVAYIPREPLCLGLHCTYEDVRPILEEATQSTFRSNANIGMRDKFTGEMVAFVQNQIITSPDAVIFVSGGFPKEKSNTYRKVLHDFCSGINVLKEGRFKKQLEVQCICVHPNYSNRGLAKELIRLSEEKGKEMGCDVATIQAVNCVTDHIVRKMGYQEIHRLGVSTLKKEDGHPLLDLAAMAANGTTHLTYVSKTL